MYGIKSIKFKKNNEIFSINIGNEVKVSYEDNVKIVDSDTILNYIEYLFRIISEWKSKYINYDLIDSEYWNLLIIFETGDKKEYCGNRDFPDNFQMIEVINQKLIEGDL